MSNTETESGFDSEFSRRVARLRPIAHALADPYFKVVNRPVDASWTSAGITKSSAGFNPAHHVFYAAKQSLFAEWIAAPDTFRCPVDRRKELAYEAVIFAHDYLHSWGLRLISELCPGFRIKTPENQAELREQAFFLILSEAVATVGLDYWYLSKAGVEERTGADFQLGPLTIKYFEKYLPLYRRADPDLTIRTPQFFDRLFRLYSLGEFHGFSETDLAEIEQLDDWMRGELRISRHQRNLALNWLSYLGGIPIDGAIRADRFGDNPKKHAWLVAEIGRRLWQKIRYGQHDFVPLRSDPGKWEIHHDGPADCCFMNLNRVGERELVPLGQGARSWTAFVDQALSGRRLPREPASRRRISKQVDKLRADPDRSALETLLASLDPGRRAGSGAPWNCCSSIRAFFCSSGSD